MARIAEPWYRAGKGRWYVTIDGEQVPVGGRGPDTPASEAAAWEAFQQVLKSLGKQPSTAFRTVAAAIGSFLADCENKAPSTLRSYRWYLGIFGARFGGHSLHQVDAKSIERDANSRPTWGDDTRRNYLASIEACFKFAGRVIKLDKPARGSAGPDSVIPEKVYWQAVGAAKHDLRALLIALWNTGARPSELTKLTTDGIDWSNASTSLRKHKTAKQTKRVRVIHFPPDAMAVLEEQRDKYGDGLLFRTRSGSQWSAPVLSQAVWRIAKKIGHRITAYGCRHSLATNALEAGLPDTHVAAILGHTSTRMLHHHYAHLDQNARLLKEALNKVRPAS
jgi:integrase